ncbi:MAG TPA: hypothetical protein VK816_05705, partial [Jatrophihabitantaceae bacterium]|nr:hypothetical protein [Jatrophihabitantaceae bacterium]
MKVSRPQLGIITAVVVALVLGLVAADGSEPRATAGVPGGTDIPGALGSDIPDVPFVPTPPSPTPTVVPASGFDWVATNGPGCVFVGPAASKSAEPFCRNAENQQIAFGDVPAGIVAENYGEILAESGWSIMAGVTGEVSEAAAVIVVSGLAEAANKLLDDLEADDGNNSQNRSAAHVFIQAMNVTVGLVQAIPVVGDVLGPIFAKLVATANNIVGVVGRDGDSYGTYTDDVASGGTPSASATPTV